MGKIIKSCQLCGGPISNGRCQYCGMPYQRDDDRYHLNEDRREHYRHASPALRRKMENEEKALPDQKPVLKPAARVQPKSSRTPKMTGETKMPVRPAAHSQNRKKEANAESKYLYAILLVVGMILVLGLESCRF